MRHSSERGGETYQSCFECFIEGEFVQRLRGDKIRVSRDWRMLTFAHFEILAEFPEARGVVLESATKDAKESREGGGAKCFVDLIGIDPMTSSMRLSSS
jgi:hypothetical protein